MTAMVAKYRTIFVIALIERFTYRTDFFLTTLMRFLPIVTTIFLWGAIYAGSDNEEIAGLSAREMVAYFLLVTVTRAFSSMPGLASGIAASVRDGSIKKYLAQPVNLLGFLLMTRLAHKLVYYTIAIGPFALVFYLCRGYFSGWPPTEVLCGYIVALLLSFVIGFLFEACVGLLSFWILEISSLNFIVMALNYVLSGHMFPLDLFPGWLGTAVKALPFQYMAYFPAKLFLDQPTMPALLYGLAMQAGCAAVLFILMLTLYRRGLRRYSAFGG